MLRFLFKSFPKYVILKAFQEVRIMFLCFKTLITMVFKMFWVF